MRSCVSRALFSLVRENLPKETQNRLSNVQNWKLLSSKASLDGDACTIEDGGNPIAGNSKFENRRIRRNLALAYRLLNRLELNEGVCNHLTAMAPRQDNSSEETMLVIPGKARFCDIVVGQIVVAINNAILGPEVLFSILYVQDIFQMEAHRNIGLK